MSSSGRLSTRVLTGRRARSVLVLAALAVGATTFAEPAAAAPAAAPPTYVALGDSYTSGPLVGNQQLSGLGCFRSDINYPKLAAKALGTTVKDVSCSGASSIHVTAAQTVVGLPTPPQLDAVTANATRVSMGFGGNDIKFVEIITGCASLLPFGSPCRNKHASGGVDALAARIDAAGPGVGQAIAAVKAKAPGVRIFVVGYPALLPESGSCWPQMPYTRSDVSYLRDVNKRLNAMLAGQAAAAGATYVDVYTPSIGHDACKSKTNRWVEPIVPGNPAAPVHPNAAGNAGMAQALVAAMTARG